MNERQRNIAVGLTVLAGMVVLAGLILIFTGLPEMFQTGTRVVVHLDRGHGILAGDPVYLLDRRVGVITDVKFTGNDPRKGVTVKARIESDIRLPKSVQAKIYSRGLMGKATLTLDPTDDGPSGFYKPNEEVTLSANYQTTGGGSLIPKDVTDSLKNFGDLAKNLNALLAPPDSQPSSQPADNLPGLLTRMNRTLDSIYAITNDPKNRKNIQSSLEGIAKTSASADELMRRLMLTAEKIDTLVLSLNKTVNAVNESKGTAGKLINDPKLYDDLSKAVGELNALLKDLRRLAEHWEEKGVGVKLK